MVDVNTINPGTVFAWFMLAMLVRRAVLIALLNVGLRSHPVKRGARAPEDNFGQKERPEASARRTPPIEFTLDMRVNRTITNDSENDAYFLILLLATAAFSDSVSGNATRTIVYSVIYLFARICYAVIYLVGLQPWRTILFASGLACTIACNLDLVITLSRRSN